MLFESLCIEQVMIKDPIQVKLTKIIKDVARISSKNGFHVLPSVEEQEMIGIITTTDLLSYMIN